MGEADLIEKGSCTLLTGETVPKLQKPVRLTPVETHCPRKWALIDLKTGNIYGWTCDGDELTSVPTACQRNLERATREMARYTRAKR